MRNDPPGRPLTLGTRVTYWARRWNSANHEYDVERWDGEVQYIHCDPHGKPTHATVQFDGSFFGKYCERTVPIAQLKIDPEHA